MATEKNEPGTAGLLSGSVLRALSRSTNDGLLLVSSAGDVDFANDSALDLFECETADDFLPRWQRLKSKFEKQLSRPGAAESGGASFLLHVGIEGSTRYLQFQVYRIDEEECVGYLVVVKDQRAVSNLEKNLAAADRLRSLMQAYRTTVHDIKTPMNALALNVELLRESLLADDLDDPQARSQQLRASEVIGEEVDRLNGALMSILDHSFGEEDEGERVGLVQTLARTIELFEPLAEQHGLDIDVEYPDREYSVFASRNRLRRAIENILVNAVEAMPKGGHMRIRIEPDDEQVRLKFADDGPGMSREVSERIFRLNYTTKAEGSGIGLYMVNSVVKASGGKVMVQSELGSGTTFTLHFPFVSDQPGEADA